MNFRTPGAGEVALGGWGLPLSTAPVPVAVGSSLVCVQKYPELLITAMTNRLVVILKLQLLGVLNFSHQFVVIFSS